MMREVLFRGKRKDNSEWVEGNLRQDKDIGASYISGWNYYTDCAGFEREPFEYEVIPETVGQYTGLNGNNGRKIFEGDIVECFDERINVKFYAVVEFGNPNGEFNWGYQLNFISGDRPNLDILCWVEMEETGAYIRVIGNIYDTRKPLKQTVELPEQRNKELEEENQKLKQMLKKVADDAEGLFRECADYDPYEECLANEYCQCCNSDCDGSQCKWRYEDDVEKMLKTKEK